MFCGDRGLGLVPYWFNFDFLLQRILIILAEVPGMCFYPESWQDCRVPRPNQIIKSPRLPSKKSRGIFSSVFSKIPKMGFRIVIWQGKKSFNIFLHLFTPISLPSFFFSFTSISLPSCLARFYFNIFLHLFGFDPLF